VRANELLVAGSLFENNEAGEDGGALYSYGGVVVTDSHFQSNSADSDGGAISGGYKILTNRSSFFDNFARDNGGAVFASDECSCDGNSESTFFHSTFFDNFAGWDGGAVYQSDEDAIFVFSTLVDNLAEGDAAIVFADGEDIAMYGSIVASASSSSSTNQFYVSEDFYDYGGNVFTQTLSDLEEDISYNSYYDDTWYDDLQNEYVEPEGPEPLFGVTYEELDLGEPAQFDNGTYGFVPGSNSVANSVIPNSAAVMAMLQIDYDESELTGDYVDFPSFETLFSAMLVSGDFFDQAGNIPEAWTSETAFYNAGSVSSLQTPSDIPYTGPVVTNDPQTAARGKTVTYTGSNLDDVTSATIAGQSVTIISKTATAITLSVPSGIALGYADVVLSYGSGQIVRLQNALIAEDPIKVWTQLQADGTVKMYAKNIIGVGKIQFYQDGKEVAWVRATDALNPKLANANGSSYLVRTRETHSGKNRFEIKLNGVQIWRATYSK